jgi:mannose-6-phosphate isomerase-like protein (cupin superfamily)
MKPGGIQKSHHHKTEQCYMILEGNGVMEINGEQSEVSAGDTIFIPSNSFHGLRNENQKMLKYLSAGSPVSGEGTEREFWPLSPVNLTG